MPTDPMPRPGESETPSAGEIISFLRASADGYTGETRRRVLAYAEWVHRVGAEVARLTPARDETQPRFPASFYPARASGRVVESMEALMKAAGNCGPGWLDDADGRMWAVEAVYSVVAVTAPSAPEKESK